MNKLLPLLAVSALLITGCSNPNADTGPSNTETSPALSESSLGENYSTELKESLIYNLTRKSDANIVWPFFIDEDDFEVISDPNFENVEVNVRSWISSEDRADFKVGRKLAVPRSGASLNTDDAKVICAKDVMQTFTTWVLFLMEDLPSPKQSLKITVEFYTVTGSAKEDEFGNVDISGLKDKILVKSMIHISNSNLNKITDPWGPDDYYVLSDLSKPVRHLAAWNSCKSYDL